MIIANLRRKLLRSLERVSHGSLSLALPDGSNYNFTGPEDGPSASVRISDWSVFRNIALSGDIGFARDYARGLWDSHDPAEFIAFAIANEPRFVPFRLNGLKAFLFNRLHDLFYRNSLQGSRDNIRAHYDLGNDFYRLWLDPLMTYSSALFAGQPRTLEQAQLAKYDRIIERLNPAGNVLEIGCGWGGFAERALAHGNYRLKGITLSQQQRDFAQNRLGDAGEIALEDYRHQQGRYDNIVSIEMIEAVGEQYWPVYFAKLAEILAPKGKVMIQAITIADDKFADYRIRKDFIRHYIFPGGMLPSYDILAHHASNHGLVISDAYDFGGDYATTLAHWLTRFNDQESAIRALGHGDDFIRMWRLYLAACIAGFRQQRTNVIQLQLMHRASISGHRKGA